MLVVQSLKIHDMSPIFCHVTISAFCRCNFLLNNVIDKVLLLTRRREKYLVVAAVRFVRTILTRHVSHVDIFFCLMNLFENSEDFF